MLKKIGRNAYHLNTADRCYLIQDLIPGKTILDAQNEIAQLDDFKTINFIQALLIAYNNFTQRGIIHRDLKPDNILVDFQSGKINIIDLSFCITQGSIKAENQKKLFDEKSFINRAMGSSIYIHPETISKLRFSHSIAYNNKSDIFGLLISIAMLCKVKFYLNKKNSFILGDCSTHQSSSFFREFVLNHLLDAIYRTGKEQNLPSIDTLQRFFNEIEHKLAESNVNQIGLKK